MALSTALETLQHTKLASAIRAGLSMVVAGAFVYDNNAYAQTADDDDSDKSEEEAILEEVIVTGFAGSLRSAQAIKESSDVVIDSITAEDIGALPDRSVTEALQRIPGVSINRFSAGRDPDHFSVEGSGLVIRGLTYVKSEINGRESFTANNGRGLSFADIPAELLAGVDVYKSLTADRLEGGISGTVNLRTRKPFDSQENILAFSAEATYSDFIEETSPRATILGSYRWDTSVGEFGVLGSLTYSQVQSRADKFQISNFAQRTLYESGDVVPAGDDDMPVKDVWFPRGAVMGSQEFDRERHGYAASIQWSSPDDTMEATAEFLRSDAREAWTEHTMEIATDVVADQGDSRAVPGTTFTFGNNDIFESGYITAPVGWRDDQWNGPPAGQRTPVQALQGQNIYRAVDQKFVTDDYSLNFKWFLENEWALNFDYQHVDSTVDNLDAGLWSASFQDAYIKLNGSNLPTVAFQPPAVCTDPPSNTCPTYWVGHESYTDPYNSFWRAAMDHIEESEGNLDSFRVDVSKAFTDTEWLEGIQFGARYADRDQTARFSTYNWGVLSEIWGEGGPVWLDQDPSSSGAGFEEFYFKNFMARGKNKNPLGGDGRLFYAGHPTKNYDEYAAYALAIANTWRPGDPQGNWMPLADRQGVVSGTPFTIGEINPVREKNSAAYVQLKFGHDLGSWQFAGNVGLRYAETDRTSQGAQQYVFESYPTDESCESADPEQPVTSFCSLDPNVRQEMRDFSNGTVIPIKDTLSYDHWLPSVNLLWRNMEGLQFRASYFKGIAPPDFGLTRNYYNINLQYSYEDLESGNGRPISRYGRGNPYLLPTESDNFDVTAEWYFADVGQLTFALFYKELEKVRTNFVQRTTNTNNGSTFEAIEDTAISSKETGKIKGFEIAYQQQYTFWDGWLGGLGLNANYTYVDSSNVPQSTLSETDPDVAAGNQTTIDTSLLPLEGLSEHTVNIQPFWEYDKWSVRLAYSWRSEFLLTVRDVIVPYQPIMNEDTGQLDASVFYQINDHFRIGFQGTNLTQETIQTSAVLNDDLDQAPRSWYLNDRRYSLVFRGNF